MASIFAPTTQPLAQPVSGLNQLQRISQPAYRNMGNIGNQGFNPNFPANAPVFNQAQTEAQNQWLNPGNMPIDEGKVAYQRQLEAGRIAQEQAAQAREQAFQLGQQGADADLGRGQKGQQFSYQLGQQGADANQQRMFQTLDKLGIGNLWGYSSANGNVPPRESGGDASWGAAQAAAMGQAKDMTAAGVGAARRSMLNNMAQRGISGSGIEAKQDMGIQLAGAGNLGEAWRDTAQQTAARQASVNDRNYAGNIQQRGQDIQAQQGRLQLLPSLLSLFRMSASY